MTRFLFVIFLLVIVKTNDSGQDKTVLTISLPERYQNIYDKTYFDAFREKHPDTDVVVKPDTNNVSYPPSPAYASISEHLEKTADYVSIADVLFVSSWTITKESTQAGLWLNQMPLVAADSELDEANFYPPAWRSFRWDNGMWALPTIFTPEILVYDAGAFDDAGLSYPKANWTIDDYAATALKLTKYDDKGQPIQPGCWCDIQLLFYSLLHRSLTDADGLPALEDPQLATIMETWSNVQKQIYPNDGYSSKGVPLLIMEPYALSPDYPNGKVYIPGDMPNHVFGASAYGFGISPGTTNPELAFQLVKYLSENPVNFGVGFGVFSALRNVQLEARTGFIFRPMSNLPPEQEALLQQAAETAVVRSDMEYFDYISQAVYEMSTNDTSATTVLQEAQQKALENRIAAMNWKGTREVTVVTPMPTPSFDSNKFALNFGLSQGGIPNQEQWDRLASEFAKNDPEIGVVNINREGNNYDRWNSENDCFYLNYDAVSPSNYINYFALDPWMDADPAFNQDDFIPGTIQALQLEGKTFGYPLSVEISALAYNPEQFEKANVLLPEMNWNINQFIDTLNQLAHSGQKDFMIPFAPRVTEDTDWLILMASYGALPIDYRTNPVTLNFTNSQTIDGIRQVLDLAKNGLIDYQQLGTFSYSGVQKQGAVNAITLSGNRNYQISDETAFVSYPQGITNGVISLGNVGGGYISLDTLHGDACYRWIAFVAAHPELLDWVMPARLSSIDNPVIQASQGETIVTLYKKYVELATNPKTLNIPSGFGSTFEGFFVHQFLDRAFDAYVLQNADLEQSLSDAQSKAMDFMQCAQNTMSLTSGVTQDEIQANDKALESCIAQVSPEMARERQEMMPSS